MSEAHVPSPSGDEQTGRSPPVPPAEEAQVLGDLERLYQPIVARNARSVERVRSRLAEERAYVSSRRHAPQSPHAMERHGYPKEPFMHPIFTRFWQGGAWRRGISTLAAVVVVALLLGSMIAVFTLVRSGKNVPATTGPSLTGTTPTGIATGTVPTGTVPTGTAPQGLGTTVYTSPVSPDDFYAFAWSPDSKRLAASTQSRVQIWDATTGEHPLTYTPRGQGGSVLTLSWSPNGRELALGAAGSSDGVEIIDPGTGALIRAFSPASPALANQTSGQGKSPAVSAAVPFNGGSGVSATAWSPDSQLIAAAFFFVNASMDEIVIWNATSGAQVSSFTGHTAVISSLAFSADGAYIASTSYDQTVQVWDPRTKQVIFTQSAKAGGALAWSPSASRLVFASDGNTFQVWDIPTKTLITSYQATTNATLAWAPSGKAIAVASNTAVVIWDAATGAHIYTYTQTGSYVRSLAWSPNGQYLVSGGNNESGGNYAKVWEAAPLP